MPRLLTKQGLGKPKNIPKLYLLRCFIHFVAVLFFAVVSSTFRFFSFFVPFFHFLPYFCYYLYPRIKKLQKNMFFCVTNMASRNLACNGMGSLPIDNPNRGGKLVLIDFNIVNFYLLVKFYILINLNTSG